MSRTVGGIRLASVGYYLLIPGLLLFDWAVFRYLLGTDYLAWYIANGALIGISTAFVARVWESVELFGRPLVSADPRKYYGGCLSIAGTVIFLVGTWVRPAGRDEDGGETGGHQATLGSWSGGASGDGDRSGGDVGLLSVSGELLRTLWFLSEKILVLVIALGILAAVFGWLLFVAPANYVVTLVAGVPARGYLRNPRHRVLGVVEPAGAYPAERTLPRPVEATAELTPGEHLHLYEVGRDGGELKPEEVEALGGKESEGKFADITFGRDPFGTTQTLAGFVVFAVGVVV